jgi:hypothetical protein
MFFGGRSGNREDKVNIEGNHFLQSCIQADFRKVLHVSDIFSSNKIILGQSFNKVQEQLLNVFIGVDDTEQVNFGFWSVLSYDSNMPDKRIRGIKKRCRKEASKCRIAGEPLLLTDGLQDNLAM